MTRKRHHRKPGPRREAPAAIPAGRGHVAAIDSEDEAGTYAPPRTPIDTGETDEGVCAPDPITKEAIP